jgi:hypothetical protein
MSPNEWHIQRRFTHMAFPFGRIIHPGEAQMTRSRFVSLMLGLALGLGGLLAAPPAQAQAYYFDRATGQWQYDPRPHKPRAARAKRVAAGPDATLRSCRRQVRQSVGYVPGRKMRLPRAYAQLVDRCVANGGVYS